MKRKIKSIIVVFAVCTVAAMAAMFTGCKLTDTIKDKIEQAKCEHEWNEGEVTKEATCVEVGELTKTCLLCNKVETEEIEKVDHIAVAVAAVEATCTKTGLTDGVKCAVCDKVLVEQTVVPVKGHNVVTDAAIAATCTTEGKTKGSHCVNCNEVLEAQKTIPATGHSLVEVKGYEATCDKTGMTGGIKCSSCGVVFTGQETIAPLGHEWDEGVTIKAATCATTGSMRYICSVCGDTKIETISATGDHSVVSITGKAATCAEYGLTDGQKCSTCGQVLVKQERISKLAHVDFDGDLRCDVCSSLAADFSGYTETALTNGTSIANKYFRVYTSGSWFNSYSMFSVSVGILDSYPVSLYIGVHSSDLTHLWVGWDPIQSPEHDIPYVVGDGYIDFYLPEGLEIKLSDVWSREDMIVTIDSDMVVESITSAYRDSDSLFILTPPEN